MKIPLNNYIIMEEPFFQMLIACGLKINEQINLNSDMEIIALWMQQYYNYKLYCIIYILKPVNV